MWKFGTHAISVRDLEQVAEYQGTRLKRGDILITTTGFTEDLAAERDVDCRCQSTRARSIGLATPQPGAGAAIASTFGLVQITDGHSSAGPGRLEGHQIPSIVTWPHSPLHFDAKEAMIPGADTVAKHTILLSARRPVERGGARENNGSLKNFDKVRTRSSVQSRRDVLRSASPTPLGSSSYKANHHSLPRLKKSASDGCRLYMLLWAAAPPQLPSASPRPFRFHLPHDSRVPRTGVPLALGTRPGAHEAVYLPTAKVQFPFREPITSFHLIELIALNNKQHAPGADPPFRLRYQLP
ncbi:uncharacterized protein PV07_08687 [Cladophialophora immunda]|uniref:Pyruvate kinase n=1 Tax=Cladophialophora immunda TaxID=569365 RepID=A0A0D1ZCT2_9EURO|nr:uncharacterized protein PV07_08687 [Cladophialophora immunda]KIW25521.1 hypothetical protein PV07_08687 [Cladophialophora immunda]